MGTSEDRDRIRSRLDAIANNGAARSPADDPADESATPDWLTEPQSPPGAWWAPERLRSARLNPGRRGAVALAVVGLLAAVFAGLSVVRDKPVAQAVPPLPVVHAESSGAPRSAQPSSAKPPPEAAATDELVVSVVGLVNRGGLVKLAPGSRVADALAAAGGAKDGADLLSLNMAQRISDGDQILVGVASQDGGPPVLGSATVGPGAAKPADSRGGKAAPGGKVSLNSASEQELDALPGVGPVTAAAIVAWRNSNGKFTDVEQLGEVDGIGPGRLAKLRDLVSV